MDEITLVSRELQLTLDPGCGGRISSLVYRPTGQELLWRQPRLADWPQYGVPESQADVQGWDECCPAIGPGPFPPGPWAETHNPAQGEVYALPWGLVESGEAHATLQVHGLRFPYHLQREVRLANAGAISLRYRLRNHAGVPFPCIWSAHPLLTAPAGARIVLPAGVRETILDSSEGGQLGNPYDRVAWPHAIRLDGGGSDLTRVAPGSGWGDKLYVPIMPEGFCRLERVDGPSLTFRWDTDVVRSLGIWIDTRGAGQARVALEPCAGYPDLMHEAAAWGSYMLLAPYEERTWEIRLTVEA